MTETELKNTVQKAQRAEQLLNDPLNTRSLLYLFAVIYLTSLKALS